MKPYVHVSGICGGQQHSSIRRGDDSEQLTLAVPVSPATSWEKPLGQHHDSVDRSDRMDISHVSLINVSVTFAYTLSSVDGHFR